MKKIRIPLLFMLLVFCFFGQINAQKTHHEPHYGEESESISFCGEPALAPPLNPQQASVQDRWNNPVLPMRSAQQNRTGPGSNAVPKALAPIDCGTGFVLTFQDIESGTGEGFDDPTLSPCGTGLTLGEERVSTVCAVFDYVSSVIDMGAVNTTIYFPISEMDGLGALASAGPLFDVGISPGTYTAGYLRDHIVNGTDPNPSAWDAIIKFDFGIRYIGGEPFEIFPCTSCPDGELDMYSILLHEVTHALGFFSLIDSDGSSKYSGLAAGPFSRFDDYMLNGAATGILTGGGAFAGPLVDLNSNTMGYFGPGNTQNEPVYSPVTWSPGSSLSHFDGARSSFDYVMHPSTSGGDNRKWTMPEIEVLTNLGYTLKSGVYTGTPAPNRYVIGVNDDGYTTTPGTTICIPALGNDTDPDGDPISYGDCGSGCTETPADLTVLLGSGTATIVSGEVCFTPELWYGGPVIIKYCPTDGKYDSDLVDTDNCTLIFIDVDGPCPGDPCNLVCNGEFENRSDNCVNSFNFSTLIACPSTFIANVCRTRGSGDILVRGCPGMSSPANVFDIPNNLWAGYAPDPGTNTWNFPNPDNNTYMGMWEKHGTPYIEGIYMQLSSPLTVGESYEVSFRVSAKTQSGPAIPSALMVGFTSAAPVLGPFDVNSVLDWYAASNSPTPAEVNVPATVKTVLGEWYLYTMVVTPTIPNLEYIIFEPSLLTPATHNNYLFLDDVKVGSAEPEILIEKKVDNSNPSPGDEIVYTIIVSNMDPTNPATGLNLYDLLPDGLTYVDSDFNLPDTDHFISFLGPLSSIMVKCTAEVDMDAPLGVPITNCAYLTSGNNCLNYDEANCADILIKATDLVVTKTLTSGPGPYLGGDLVTFEITVDNVGPMDAGTIWVEDLLPPEMTYVSHTVTGGGFYSHPNLSIASLLVGNQVVLELTVMINSLATCGTYTNCANLVELAEVDLVISNNSDCADVEVGSTGGAPSSYPVHPLGTDIERAHGVYKPATGLYITGDLNNSIDFGDGPMTTVGNQDAFVVKYGDCGIDWQHSEGGSMNDNGVAITEAPVSGRLYACGNAGSAFSYQGVSLPGAGTYIVELNPANGLGIWGRVIPNTSVEDIAVDAVSGNVAVVGSVTGPFVFASTPYGTVGGSDMYIAVYDANGTELWADTYGSTANDFGTGVAFHPTGRVYMTGGIGNWPTSMFGGTTPSYIAGTDGFAGRYSPSGVRANASYFASQGNDMVNDIVIDQGSGQLYVTGINGASMVIGGGPVINAIGTEDAFAASLSGGFSGIWAHDWGSGGLTYNYGESIDLQGTMVFVAGAFQGSASFPGFPNPSLVSSGAYDIFMATINSSTGVPINNIKSDNYNHWTNCFDIMGDAAGNGYIAGDFYATTTFGISSITSFDGAADAYVARGDGNPSGVFYKVPGAGPGAQAESDLKALEVFPNPSNGSLTIRRISGQAEQVRLVLTDLHGKTEVLEEAAPFEAGELQIQLDEKSAGIYFLHIEFDGQSQTEKIVLMRD